MVSGHRECESEVIWWLTGIRRDEFVISTSDKITEEPGAGIPHAGIWVGASQ